MTAAVLHVKCRNVTKFSPPLYNTTSSIACLGESENSPFNFKQVHVFIGNPFFQFLCAYSAVLGVFYERFTMDLTKATCKRYSLEYASMPSNKTSPEEQENVSGSVWFY